MSEYADLVIVDNNSRDSEGNSKHAHDGNGKPNRDFHVHSTVTTKDGLRSWLVCLLCSSVTFVVYGFYSCYGLFMIEFLKEFKETEAKTGKRTGNPQLGKHAVTRGEDASVSNAG